MPIQLDGTNSLIRDSADVCVANAHAAFTILCWLKQPAAPAGTQNLLSMGNSADDSSFLTLRSRNNNSDKFRARIRNNEDADFFAYARLPHIAGLWVPCMVRSNGTTLEHWNGNFGGSLIDDGTATLTGTLTLDQLAIGALYLTSLDTNRWIGDIAEMMLFSRAITDTEYRAYCNGMSSTAEGTFATVMGTTGLEAYYPFSTTTTLTDQSGNSRDLSAADGTAAYAVDATLFQDVADLATPTPTKPVIVAPTDFSGTNEHTTYLQVQPDTIMGVQLYLSEANSSAETTRIDGYNIAPGSLGTGGLANSTDDYGDVALFHPTINRAAINVADGISLLGIGYHAACAHVGIFESHAAIHCSSPEIVHTDGYRYRSGATKNNSVYLAASLAADAGDPVILDVSNPEIEHSRLGSANGMPLPGHTETSQLNEEYHNGNSVSSFIGGIVIVRSSHNDEPYLRIRVRRDNKLATPPKVDEYSDSKTFLIGGASSLFSYNHVVCDSSNNIHILTRGDNLGVTLNFNTWIKVDMATVLSSWDSLDNDDELIAEGHATERVIGALRYPRAWRLATAKDGTELLFGASDIRETVGDTHSRGCCAYLIDVATENFYNLKGDEFSGRAGTSGDPFIAAAELSIDTVDGLGFRVVGDPDVPRSIHNPDGMLIDVSNWTLNNRKATAIIPCVQSVAESLLGLKDYADSEWFFYVHTGDAIYTHSQTLGTVPAWFGAPNSQRLSIGMVWQDDVQGVRVLGCSVVRNKRITQKMVGGDEVTYYDWGGNAIQAWSVSALESATPVWERLNTYQAATDNPVTAIHTVAGDVNGAFIWNESAEQSVSANHHQTVRRREVITSSTATSATTVNDKRTFLIKPGRGYRSERIVVLQPGFKGTLAVDYSECLNTGETIIDVATVADELSESPALTATNLSISSDGTQAHFNVEVPESDYGKDYRYNCTVLTSDIQTIPSDCRLQVRE